MLLLMIASAVSTNSIPDGVLRFELLMGAMEPAQRPSSAAGETRVVMVRACERLRLSKMATIAPVGCSAMFGGHGLPFVR
jgi:hypothetical protein